MVDAFGGFKITEHSYFDESVAIPLDLSSKITLVVLTERITKDVKIIPIVMMKHAGY